MLFELRKNIGIRVSNPCELQLGDVIYTPLYGIWRHYGIITEKCSSGEYTVRSVHLMITQPVDLALSRFSAGNEIYKID